MIKFFGCSFTEGGGLDDFEDLDKPADQPMGLGDFETLA